MPVKEPVKWESIIISTLQNDLSYASLQYTSTLIHVYDKIKTHSLSNSYIITDKYVCVHEESFYTSKTRL